MLHRYKLGYHVEDKRELAGSVAQVDGGLGMDRSGSSALITKGLCMGKKLVVTAQYNQRLMIKPKTNHI